MGHTQVHNHWSAVRMGFIYNDKAMDQRERTKHMDMLYFSLFLLVYIHAWCICVSGDWVGLQWGMWSEIARSVAHSWLHGLW